MIQNNDAGVETCEERGYTGGDADDVWFYYHTTCFALQEREAYRIISFTEAERRICV